MPKKASNEMNGAAPTLTKRALLESFELIDAANNYAVPWREQVINAISGDESQYMYWFAELEDAINKEIAKIGGGGNDADKA